MRSLENQAQTLERQDHALLALPVRVKCTWSSVPQLLDVLSSLKLLKTAEKPSVGVHIFDPRQRQVDLCGFEANLVYKGV